MEESNDSGSSNAFGWVVLLIVILLAGWFLFRYMGTGTGDSDIDVNVDLPTGEQSGGTSTPSQ